MILVKLSQYQKEMKYLPQYSCVIPALFNKYINLAEKYRAHERQKP